MTESERTEYNMARMLREQRDRSMLRREVDHHVKEVKETGTFHIVHLSDIHFGHDAVDYRYLDEVMTHIYKTPGMYLMLYGDLIEGFNKEYVDTNNQHLLIPVEEQIIMLREKYIKPLQKEGKILGMVSRFTQSHEGWALKESNTDLYALLTLDTDIPLISNGGIIEIRARNKHTVRIRAFHNSPKSGNDMSPISGLRNSELTLPGYVDMVFAGDRHTLGGTIAVERDADGTIMVYGQIPPFKGNPNSEMPDYLMMAKFGNRPSAPGGLSTIHGKFKNGTPYVYASRDLELATNRDRLLKLGDVLDANPDARDEINSQIGQRKAMQIKFNTEKSKKLVQDDDREAVSYAKATFDIENADYLIPLVIAGFRVGSKSSNPKLLRRAVQFIANTPNAVAITGAENIDRNVVHNPHSDRIVSTYLNIMQAIYGKWILSLNDSIMRHEDWKKTDFMPATEIQQRGGAVLTANQGEFYLALKNGNRKVWSGLLIDGSGSRSAPSDPYRLGVATEVQNFKGKNRSHDLVIGSRSPNAGVQSRYNSKTGEDQLFFAPGMFAFENVVGGKGNSSRSAEGGLGAILTSWGEAYPFLSLDEAELLTKDIAPFAYLYLQNSLDRMIQGLTKKPNNRRTRS